MDIDIILNNILNSDNDKAKQKLEIICESGIFDNPDYPKDDYKYYINYILSKLERILYLKICNIHPLLEELEHKKILALISFKNLYNPEQSDELKENFDKALLNYETYFHYIKKLYPCYDTIRNWSLDCKYQISPY